MHLVVAGLKKLCPTLASSCRFIKSTMVTLRVGGTAFRPRGTPLALVVVAIL
jgi:hypothetical protein